ncbi:MAG: DUF2007 domain-containing protein [Bacteroidales bacterium]|nr:DUF2007 domain-containing protein [Bacteroidales bacterium]
MKIVARYTNAFDAHIAQGLLESEGILSEVTNESSIFPGFGEIRGYDIRLVVNDEDYEEAKRILDLNQ